MDRIRESVFQFSKMHQLKPAIVNEKQAAEACPQQKHTKIERKRGVASAEKFLHQFLISGTMLLKEILSSEIQKQ